jgi:hypothetical protein
MAPRYACCSDVPYENLVRFLTVFERAKIGGDARARQLEEFRLKNVVRPSADVYAIYRLLLPKARAGGTHGAALGWLPRSRPSLLGARGARALVRALGARAGRCSRSNSSPPRFRRPPPTPPSLWQHDRRIYLLKEIMLGRVLVKAIGCGKAAPIAQRVLHW